MFTIAVRTYTSTTKFQPSTIQAMASHSSGLLFFDSLVQRGVDGINFVVQSCARTPVLQRKLKSSRRKSMF